MHINVSAYNGKMVYSQKGNRKTQLAMYEDTEVREERPTSPYVDEKLTMTPLFPRYEQEEILRFTTNA